MWMIFVRCLLSWIIFSKEEVDYNSLRSYQINELRHKSFYFENAAFGFLSSVKIIGKQIFLNWELY